MRDEIFWNPPSPDATGALSRYLAAENEVLRCAATRALVAMAGDAPEAKSRLEDLLLDPDPDVRTDAMTGFAELAIPADADTLRRSLEGDPVREVKLAVLVALSRLRDAASVDLLRALVLGRAEDRVAWEEDGGDWDDWLDIQIAAIVALGQMGATDAIGDILAARDDEFGQTLDMPVFNTLADLGEEGAVWLLAIVRTETGLARTRAIEVLAQMAPEKLSDVASELLDSDDAVLRAIAVRLLPADSPEAADLALNDPAAKVRLSALNHCLAAQPDLARAVLWDDAPDIQAAGLTALQLPLEADFQEALVDNMLLWLEQGAPVLMTAAAVRLPRFAPDRAEHALLDLVVDARRSLEARLAGVRALAEVQPPVKTETLTSLLANPAQQVRTAILTLVRDRAIAGDELAQEAVCSAISGTLLSEEAATVVHADEGDAPDLATPKGEGDVSPGIRITREGDIVDVTDTGEDTSGSTLASILTPNVPEAVALAGETPEESTSKRRNRRPVEGPDEVANALMREALITCGTVASEQIEAAVLEMAQAEEPDLRRRAWQALSVRCAGRDADAPAIQAAGTALGDEDPVVRLAAFDVLSVHGPSDANLARALEDPDALLRAAALGYAPVAIALTHLGDNAQPARRAALNQVLALGSAADIEAAADILLDVERADTLSELLRVSVQAQSQVLDRLAHENLADRQALVSLDALARMANGADGMLFEVAAP